MPTESGYGNKKAYGRPQHKTLHNLGSSRIGSAVSTKALSELGVAIAISTVVVSDDQKTLTLTIPAHGARVDDVLRLTDGVISAYELDVISVIDANTVEVYNIGEPDAGDLVKVMRWVTSKADSEGNLNFSPGPTQFVKDGVAVQVNKDTVTPGNTVGLPVEIVAASGTEINITAGDINIQTSHTGANPDSMRIGDGATELAIEAVTGKALVKDENIANVVNEVDTVLTKNDVVNIGGLLLDYNTVDAETNPQGVSGDVGRQVFGEFGHSFVWDNYTHAQIATSNGLLGATSSTAPASDTATSGLNGRLQRIAQRLTSLIALLPSTIGRKVMADSLSVTIASDQAEVPVSGPLTNTELRAQKVQVGFDPGTIDVFGRVLIGERKNQIDVQFFSDTPSNLITVTTASTGAAAQDAGGALFSTGVGVSGEVKGVSPQSTVYSAGAEIYTEVTASFVTPTSAASFQRIGLFDTNDGLYVGYSGLDFGVSLRNNAVDTFVVKASFSEDSLTGAVNSKFTRNGVPEAIDLTKQNVWRIRFGWQGSAPIFYEVMAPDGHFVTFHVIRQPNLAESAHIRNPNLPITVHLKKTASDATDLQLKTNSWGAGATVSQTRVDSTITDATLVETNRSIITGVTTGGGGGYVNVKVSPSGALVVDTGALVEAVKTPSYQEIVNLTNVAQTFTAPANAKWCKVQADDANLVNIRVKIGGAATVSSGLQFQPGRSEDYQIAGNISVIAESASPNQKIYVQFGV